MQESLSLIGRFEPSHLALPLSCRLVRCLSPIVRVPARVVGHQRYYLSMRNPIAAKLVRHETKRITTLTLQEFSKEPLRCSPVPPSLNENVDYVSVLIDRTPEILTLAVDRDE